ncbi:PRA1 family protein G2-like [Vitis riparia]|uniref:PRA1 family protein G2-like n=1 Tax=Vitis riparia TaxID=96939 RepID=UPI00155B0F9D|nr:PRA1 family protein G2-like [Vitis riparia]
MVVGSNPKMSTPAATPATYTSIPISGADVISRSFHNLSAAVSSRRPWPEFVAADVFHRPDSLTVAGERVRKNASYFRINYGILVLGSAMISLVGTPISLMVWVLTLGMWLIFYFFREDPLFVGGRQVSDRLVLLCLVLASVMAVWFTGVLENLVVGVGIGLLVCCVHGVFRNPLEDDEAGLRESALTH